MALLAGYKKYFAKNAKTLFQAEPLSPKEVEDLLVAYVEACKAVIPVRAALQAALNHEAKAEAAAASILSHIRQLAITLYGSNPEVLAEFGLAPRKKAQLQTLEERLDAKLKRRQTRKARHIMGPKQRAAIRGDAQPEQKAPTAPTAPVGASPATNGTHVLNGANGSS